MNPIEIARQLSTLGRDIDEAVKQLGDFELAAVDAEGDFRAKFAKAFRSAPGSVEDRKQAAIEECDVEWRTWGIAAAVVRRQREHLKALHARIDVGRTLASNVRAEVSLARSGVTP